MSIDLTPILQAIIALLAALVTYKLIPWIKARTNAQQQANLSAMTKIAVYAAEQLFGAGTGEKKLEYVRNILQAAGFDIDSRILRAEIENAVHNLPENVFTQYAQYDDEANDEDEADEPDEAIEAADNPDGADNPDEDIKPPIQTPDPADDSAW